MQNIVVVVTDDDASGVDENNFLSLLAGQNIPTDLQVLVLSENHFREAAKRLHEDLLTRDSQKKLVENL